MIQMRSPRLADAETIAKVHVKVWRDTYTGMIPTEILERKSIEDRQKEWTDFICSKPKGSYLLVVDIAGEVVGFCFYTTNPKDPIVGYDAEIVGINLLPEYQGLGLGRNCFEAVKAHLKVLGCKNFYLWVATQNKRAIGFYEKLLGKRIPQEKEKLGAKHISYAWTL